MYQIPNWDKQQDPCVSTRDWICTDKKFHCGKKPLSASGHAEDIALIRDQFLMVDDDNETATYNIPEKNYKRISM